MRLKVALQLMCTVAPSFVRLWIWRLLGFRIAGSCHVAPLSLIVADHIEMGHGAVIGPFNLIVRPSRFCMGERSRIASFVRIIGYGEVDLAAQTFVALGCLIDATRNFAFRMGARSEIGPRGIFYTHGATGLIFNMGFPRRLGDIVIGEDCWLGMACVVYPNVRIGDRVVITPGITIRTDVNNDVMVVPLNMCRQVPIRYLKLVPGGSDADKLTLIQEFMETYAAQHRGRIVRGADEWTAELPGRRRLILCLHDRKADTGNLRPESAVFWRMAGDQGSIPTFCFAELTIYGERTPFADDVAGYLCEQCGTHFVFSRPAGR